MAKIQCRIAQLRTETYAPLKARLLQELVGSVIFALHTGQQTRRARRALSMLGKLKVLKDDPKVSQQDSRVVPVPALEYFGSRK